MSTGAIRAVAFDLDGTLVDSRLDLAEAVNRTRGGLGFEPLAVASVVGMVGEGARNLVRRALGDAPEPALFERAFAAFLNHYDEVCLDRTRPFPGVEALLERLAARLPLAVVTNKPERFSRRIVDHLGWKERFRVLVGGDSLPTRKPDPGGLRHAADRLGTSIEGLLFVGDSRIDAQTAVAAGAPLVLAVWGFAALAERAELADYRWIDDPSELDAIVAAGARDCFGLSTG
ncbi:MAG TPA: phosphoglycolate phosphatase [Thermoanaerobaculia bacterium]|nr:phosphoglycolate phosphatase [Thermoanaerobaculia bacterium]